MKHLLAILLLLPMIASAQVVDLRDPPPSEEEAFALGVEKLDLELELAEEDTKIPALQQRNYDYGYSFDRWQQERVRLVAEKTAIVAAWSELKGRCSGTTQDPNFYNACKGEEATLKNRQERFVRDGEGNNRQQESLKMIEGPLVQGTATFNDNYVAIQNRIAWIERRLATVQATNDACEEAILRYDNSDNVFEDGTLETMKAICHGSLFDFGN